MKIKTYTLRRKVEITCVAMTRDGEKTPLKVTVDVSYEIQPNLSLWKKLLKLALGWKIHDREIINGVKHTVRGHAAGIKTVGDGRHFFKEMSRLTPADFYNCEYYLETNMKSVANVHLGSGTAKVQEVIILECHMEEAFTAQNP